MARRPRASSGSYARDRLTNQPPLLVQPSLGPGFDSRRAVFTHRKKGGAMLLQLIGVVLASCFFLLATTKLAWSLQIIFTAKAKEVVCPDEEKAAALAFSTLDQNATALLVWGVVGVLAWLSVWGAVAAVVLTAGTLWNNFSK